LFKNKTDRSKRILERTLARELTKDQLNKISGSGDIPDPIHTFTPDDDIDEPPWDGGAIH
jgi:hypothetical protein